MRTFNLTLFRKFAIGATLIVILFSIINIYILWKSGYKTFENEIDKRSKVLSRLIAEKVLQPIVYDDYINIYKVIDQIKSNDSSIAYIFVLDEKNKILAQNYDITIPYALINANSIKNGNYQIKVIETKNYKYKIIRDIAYPILDGELGTIRIGLIEEDIRKDLNRISRQMLLMVMLFLTFGLILAFFFSSLITLPIKKISKNAQNINLLTLESVSIDKNPLKYHTIFNIYLKDELDILNYKFVEMIERLIINKKELQAARDSFVQAEKMASIGTLTAGISHEINNPLAGIKNCMTRIEREPENMKQNLSYIALINDAIDRIEKIIKPLLSFSRKSELKFSWNPVGHLINNALLLTDYRIKKSNIIVEKIFDPEILIFTSVNHIEQVLINLILNGIDAIDERIKTNPESPGKLIISVINDEQKVEIKVVDNGCGIPENLRSKIFDPFFTTKEPGKGTGLGLYVSYNILKDLGGSLIVEGKENEGTEFILSFTKK